MIEIAEAEVLLKELQSIPPVEISKPTILELAGYPHYENVCSNILSFFLNPQNPHGLDNLVLKAFLNAINIDQEIGEVKVEREASTESRNRLDIIIDSDSCLIGVENKIFSGIGNPLEDYSNHLDKLKAATDKTIHKVLLTLSAIPLGESWYGFKNIIYDQLFAEIRSLLGFYVSNADNRYLILLIDFMTSIENLKRGNTMNREWMEFIKIHQEGVQGLLKQINNYRSELRNKVRDLGTLIDLHDRKHIRQWLYREPDSLYDMLVHDIKLADDLPIAVHAVVSASGWEIQIFLRSGGNREKLRSLLALKQIDFKENDRFFVYNIEELPFDVTLEAIQPHVQRIIDSLSEKPPTL